MVGRMSEMFQAMLTGVCDCIMRVEERCGSAFKFILFTKQKNVVLLKRL